MLKRKVLRLANYDYTQNGVYFLTICTAFHKPILWESLEKPCMLSESIPLSWQGRIVQHEIEKWGRLYPAVMIDKYVIMPNHIHALLRICNPEKSQDIPDISRMVKQFKGRVSKEIGEPVWQKSFYDHVIRSEEDYLQKWQYIDNNPARWKEDQYYFDNHSHTP